MISFIVPAHNEQACLGSTLQAIHESARVVGQPYEIIVVNDASTDATADVARQHNATVLPVKHRQIAATRNSGGRAARGERLFFVDADTRINPRAVASALKYMDKGAVGGGAPVAVDGEVPLYIRLLESVSVIGTKLVGFTGGAFMFCTREAFVATGGFNERLFWAEEGSFALALKREGRFAVVWEQVLTSGRRVRKMSKMSGAQALAVFGRMFSSPFKMFTRRSSVEKIWYDSNREGDDTMSNSLVVRIFNGVMLMIVIVMLTGPLWNFVPLSLTPLASPQGKVRLVIATFLSHVGLLFWPIAIVLFVNLLRRKSWRGWIQPMLLTGVCFYLAWDCTQGAIRIWTLFGHWLTGLFRG